MENAVQNMPSNPSDYKHEFVCDQPCCAGGNHNIMRIGKATATGLSGFLAGVIVTAVVLYPWLYVLGKLCPSSSN